MSRFDDTTIDDDEAAPTTIDAATDYVCTRCLMRWTWLRSHAPSHQRYCFTCCEQTLWRATSPSESAQLRRGERLEQPQRYPPRNAATTK